MKKILLLLASFVLTGTMMARQLTPDQALALALGKLKVAQPERTRAMATCINIASVRLTHTEKTSQNVPLYYIYNITEGGIIIASADNRVSSLLGYTDSGDFTDAKQNESFMAWLKSCSRALSHIDSMPEQTRSASPQTRALTTSVQPLLGEIEWAQNAPYNLLTPLRVGYPNAEAEPDIVHAPTGCTATALAQVMKYYEWPVSGTGSHTNEKDGTQSIDFSQSTYQWSKMLPTYWGDESEESKMAVAQLMNDLGCALNMNYGYYGSGTNYRDPLKALTTYFGYDKSMRFVDRTECSTEEWNHLLITELNEKRPVILSATDIGALNGHTFVIDGYDTNGLYHVNWGWRGKSNGYFDINLMDPKYQGFGGYYASLSMWQSAILGVKPDVEGTSVAKPELLLTKRFKVDKNTRQLTYDVSNYGLGDFSGEIGIAMESPTGEVAKLTTIKYADNPIEFFDTFEYTSDCPVAPGPGYKLYPYYCDVIDGEMKHITAIYNCVSTLYSAEEDSIYDWGYETDEIADIEIDSVEVKHNFVGFNPQLNITISNSADSQKEYAEDIAVAIYKEENGEMKLVCRGYAQAFINPGETKELAVRCNLVEEEFQGKILEGEYMYNFYICLGGSYLVKKSGSFEMVVTPPSDITYADFAINKTEFQQGEELVASMSVTNVGGFDLKTLAFSIYRVPDFVFVDKIIFTNAEINADSSETFTFKKTLEYAPGVYIATFFVNDVQLDEDLAYVFTVYDPTAIESISTHTVDRDTQTYDLFGNEVGEGYHGIVIRKGKKYIQK